MNISELTDRVRDDRDDFWRGVGELGAHTGATGSADEPALWPSGGSAYLWVLTQHSGILATDGLSDPSGSEAQDAPPGLGVELYVEGRELMEDPPEEGEWLIGALEEAAGAVAGAAASLGPALAEHPMLSLELSGEGAPADWVSGGRLGALVGVDLPGRSPGYDVSGASVRALTFVPLRPSELAVVRAEGDSGRQRVADALAAAGWYSYAETHRPAVL